MNWLARGLRSAAVASATLLIAATAAADVSRVRLKAIEPHWIAHGRQIAFIGWDGRHHHRERLWVMNADGSGRRALTRAVYGWYELPVLSPSGRRFADSEDFGDEGDLWILWPTGKTIRRFPIRLPADYYGYPDWSPDESAVAVEVETYDRTMIFVGELRDGFHSISHGASRTESSVDWSPDSRRIAFASCTPSPPGLARAPCNVVLSRRDGSGRKVVVHNVGKTSGPVWAPNGRAISYAVGFGAVHEEKPPKDCPKCTTLVDLQRQAIYVVRPDGSGLRRLATTTYLDTDSGPGLRWSPDSRRLAFADRRGVTIIEVNARSRRQRILRGASQSAWSPDGREIAFVDPQGVTILDVNDGREHRLTPLRQVHDLSWAPSKRLLFSQRGNLYTALPGQRPQRILS